MAERESGENHYDFSFSVIYVFAICFPEGRFIPGLRDFVCDCDVNVCSRIFKGKSQCRGVSLESRGVIR